jgi:hypothetical protein
MTRVTDAFQLLSLLCFALTVYYWLTRRVGDNEGESSSAEREHDVYNFTWTLITTIACKDSYDIGNVLAYKSWRRLRPAPVIVYVSTCHPHFAKDATTITTFDRTMSGLPLFSGMMAMTERFTTDLVAWTNADILLAGDVVTTINHLHSQQHTTGTSNGDKEPPLWMAVAARWDLSPTAIQRNDSAIIDNVIKRNDLDTYLPREGVLHRQGGGDLFVWNQPHVSTIRAPYPPYIRSSCSWDNWWIHEAGTVRSSVFDATASMTIGHIDHSYFLTNNQNEVEFHKSSSQSRWSQGVYDDWRIYHNNVVARSVSYARGFYTGLGAVMNLEDYMGAHLKLKRRHTKQQPSDYSLSLKFPIITSSGNTVADGIPSLETLLHNIPRNEHVLMTGITFGYMEMLMNWICILRQLNMDHNFLIAAFDQKSFEYLYLQGLPVFFPSGNSHNNIPMGSDSAHEYGQQSFKDTTKLKIASVKVILELGYDVLWSDSDIIFFKDFRNMFRMTQHDIIMQSNNPIPKYKGYFNQRINSGFYFIRSKASTIRLVKEIIDHSLTSLKSEQMSFDAILCANANADFCTTADNHLVTFLDYRKFPNGGVLKYWEALMSTNDSSVPEYAYILHNNWIKGYSAKMNRIKKSNFWFWDNQREVCGTKSFEHIEVVAR